MRNNAVVLVLHFCGVRNVAYDKGVPSLTEDAVKAAYHEDG